MDDTEDLERPDPTRRVHEDDEGPQPGSRELPLLESDDPRHGLPLKSGFDTEPEVSSTFLIAVAVIVVFVAAVAVIWHTVDMRAKVDIERARRQQTIIEFPQNDAGGGQHQ